jgi:tetraacyldisaccharide 4'-kinase
VGNLAIGGTGKSPMTEYLIRLLKNKFNVATLSRGYKRKTKGYTFAKPGTTALEIGDEPMQFFEKFGTEITVAVGEERVEAIPLILQDKPNTNVIILDDAFQHRYVTAGLNIVLTEYSNTYAQDVLFPVGDLRDLKLRAAFADIIVVTKCPESLSEQEASAIEKTLRRTKKQTVFFASLAYGKPYHIFNKTTTAPNALDYVLLVCGIANPKPLKSFLTYSFQTYDCLAFPDHHIFDSNDLQTIIKKFKTAQATNNKYIFTTEKDAVRLIKFAAELESLPIYALPISHKILFNSDDQFNEIITNFIKGFSTTLP